MAVSRVSFEIAVIAYLAFEEYNEETSSGMDGSALRRNLLPSLFGPSTKRNKKEVDRKTNGLLIYLNFIRRLIRADEPYPPSNLHKALLRLPGVTVTIGTWTLCSRNLHGTENFVTRSA